MALVPFPSRDDRETPDDPDGWWSTDPLGDAYENREDLQEGKMSFLEHLDELRKRLIQACLGLAGGIAIAFFFIDRIFAFIMRPLQQMLPDGGRLIYTEPTEAFVLYMKIALIAGLVIAAPYIMWQVWLFIAPGLYAKEKRFAIPFIVLSTTGFVGGAAFSHYLLFPWMWTFLASFGASNEDFLMFAPKIDAVFSLYTKLLIGMGLVFQMPSIVFFLAKMGLVTARFLLRHIKYAVLIIFVTAAVLTPSGDILTQTLMAAPMIGLYLISIAIAWLFGKKTVSTAD
jgi:sec-independent protein translocase protein TatC